MSRKQFELNFSDSAQGFTVTKNGNTSSQQTPKPASKIIDLLDDFVIEIGHSKKGSKSSTTQLPATNAADNNMTKVDIQKPPKVSNHKPIANEAHKHREQPMQKLPEAPKPAVIPKVFNNANEAARANNFRRPRAQNPAPRTKQPPKVTKEDLEIFRAHMDPLPEPCFEKLSKLSHLKLVSNHEEFICTLCERFMTIGRGITLKGCLHNFCRDCLIQAIIRDHDEMGQVKCPLKIQVCESLVDDEEVQMLLGENYPDFSLKIYMGLHVKLREAEAAKYDLIPNLLNTDNLEFINNIEVFECPVCFVEAEPGEGVVLKNCLHKVCKVCFVETVKHSDEFTVNCPEDGCKLQLQEREIKALVPDEIFEKQLAKSLKLYEGTRGGIAKHCLTPDCHGFVEADENVRGFVCPVCSKVNCLGCKAIHQGMNCEEYDEKVNGGTNRKREDEASAEAIKRMVAQGEAMYCPRCGIPVMKNEGCDFITCGTCKLGICWVTKKPRHPLTKENGVFIDGCHCREKGQYVMCHPSCKFCH